MSDRSPRRSLTRHEFDAVIRRAAELSSSESESGEGGLTEGELYRIASEVGLDGRHVRRALSEVRSGVTTETSLSVDGIFGPASVRASRVVAGTARDLAAKLDEFLVASQLLQPVRRTPNLLQYRPAVDWASQIARAASFTSRRHYVASAKSVEIHLEEVDDARSHVEIIVDPGTRNDSMAGAIFGGGFAGVGGGSLAGWALTTLVPGGFAVAVGVAGGAAIAGGIAYASGQGHKKKLTEVRLELEGVLDALEQGDSLEPPPASWRRWVKRHFHGVARDIMSLEDLDAELGDLGKRP